MEKEREREKPQESNLDAHCVPGLRALAMAQERIMRVKGALGMCWCKGVLSTFSFEGLWHKLYKLLRKI